MNTPLVKLTLLCGSKEAASLLASSSSKQWKEGKNIDPVVIALIRFLYILPQLIVVAEEQYDATKLFGI